MLEKIIPHRYTYLFFLFILVVGLSLGKIFMSIGTIGLTVNWVFEGDFLAKIDRLKKQKYSSLILSMGYFVHVLWLFNTQNFTYASKDLLVKLPLLLIPIIIGTTRKLEGKELRLLFVLFVSGVIISSFGSMLVYWNIIPPKEANALNQISLFMSHIRMGLLVAFTSILLLYITFFHNNSKQLFVVFAAIWLIVFLFFLQSITAIIAWFFGFTILIFSLKKISNRAYKLSLTLWVVCILVSTIFVWFIYADFSSVKDTRDLSSLPSKSTDGEIYMHNTAENYTENGNYVWICIAPNEVKETWNKRSNYNIDSLDSKGQKIRATLYRYLTSKGLNKDAKSINSLNDKEIKAIELGTTSCVKYGKLEKRIRGIFLELKLFKDEIEVNNHSVSQRIIFYQISKKIIQKNFFFGVGIGDLNDAFKSEYSITDTGLTKNNQKRAHNQFFSYFIVYGLFGFLLWLFTFIYPLTVNQKPQPLHWIFVITIVVGFLSDDMLERQAGVAIYITLNSLILYATVYSVDGGSNVLERTKRMPNINS